MQALAAIPLRRTGPWQVEAEPETPLSWLLSLSLR